MPSAFALIAALAVSPQQPQIDLPATIATRNRHAIETLLERDPAQRPLVIRAVRAQLGVPCPPWLPLALAWDPQSPRWPDGWKWPMAAEDTAQRWVQLGMRVATGRSPGSVLQLFDCAVQADEAAVVTILGHFVNTTDAKVQDTLWNWLRIHQRSLASIRDARVGTLLTVLFEHPRQEVVHVAVALWSIRGAREGGPQVKHWLSTHAHHILKERRTPIVLLHQPRPSMWLPVPLIDRTGSHYPHPRYALLDPEGELVLAAAAVADAELAAAISTRRNELLAKPNVSLGEISYWELCAIRAAVANPGVAIEDRTSLLCARLWQHAASTSRYPTVLEQHDRTIALLALRSSRGVSEDLLDALAAQPGFCLDALAIDLDLGNAPDALRPLVRRLNLRRAPALHAMVPDVLFDGLREGGDRMCFAYDLLKKAARSGVGPLLVNPELRERFLAAYHKAPMPRGVGQYVREGVEALLGGSPRGEPTVAQPAGEEAALIAATTDDAPDVRLAAYRALATRDPAEHLCAWLLYETPFDPDPRVRSLRLR